MAENVFDQFDAPADKPPFDPSKPFKAVKPPFDPNKPYAAENDDWNVKSVQPLGDWDVVSQAGKDDWITPPKDSGVDDWVTPGKSNPFDQFDKPAERQWSDVPLDALKNAPHSAYQFASDMVQPIIHPVDTLGNIGGLALGLMQKAGMYGGDSFKKYPDAFGKFVMDRYGSLDAFKKTMAEDPIGLLGDISSIGTGGESMLARAPGIAGKVGEAAGTVGRAVDPLRPLSAAAPLASKAASEMAGVTTGAGGEPFRVAANAGYEGGEAARAFRQNMTGAAPFDEAVDDARKALQNMRAERGKAYRDRMAELGTDKTILDFDKIDDAMRQTSAVKNFHGQDLSPKTANIRQEINDVINDWRGLDPQTFHTAEGLDALKQKVGDVRDATQYGTPERVVADRAYNAVRQTIVDQAPDYARTMKAYEAASAQIKDIEKTLSLNPNASVDTALRKLQSTLRDNVNTSFGRRAELANYLVNAGAPHLMEKLAGQALSAWAPRGLARIAMTEAIPAAAGALGAGVHGAGAGALATLPTMSPRLMGEVAYGVGKAAKAFKPQIPRIARQLGQLSRAANPQ